jgi:hypothetical protein
VSRMQGATNLRRGHHAVCFTNSITAPPSLLALFLTRRTPRMTSVSPASPNMWSMYTALPRPAKPRFTTLLLKAYPRPR